MSGFPTIDKLIKPEYFLKNVYNIESFEEGINYIKNNSEMSSITIERIVNCMFISYREQDILPNDIYIDIINKVLKDNYNIDIDKNKIRKILIENKFKDVPNIFKIFLKK